MIPDRVRRDRRFAVLHRYHKLIVDFNQRLEEIALHHQVILFDVYTITHQELGAEHLWPAIARLLGANGRE